MSQEFDNNVLDLVERKGFYFDEYMSDSEKFKGELLSKEKFYGSLTYRKITGKVYGHVFNVWKKHGIKNNERLP